MRKNTIGEEEVEEEGAHGFFACYLLTSLSSRHKGHTYIGYTVNPRRRIRQHNGEIGSGAVRTKRKRPWEMVMCIYGFPTNVSALQFEWAWQHPTESLAVRTAAASFKSLGGLANKVKLAFTMLTLSKWQDLDLTVNFFSSKYTKHSAGCPTLPEQMSVQVCSMDDLPCYTGIFTLREDEYEDEDRDDLDAGDLFDETGVTNEGLHVENDLNIYKSGEEDTAVYRGTTTIYSTYGDEYEDEHRDNRKKTNEDEDFTDDRTYNPYNWTESTDTFDFGIKNGAEDDLTRSKDNMYNNSIGDTDLFRDEIDQSDREILHTRSVCNDKPAASCPIAGGSEEVEVIDLLSPSPGYRVDLKTKRRKVYGGVIDLTNSPIFIEV